MFLRLGVYQDLCREHEHAKLSLRMLKRARKQSSFPQWWGSIVSLPEVVRYPPPAVSCRTPTQRAPWWDRLWQLLSPSWPSLMGCSAPCWVPAAKGPVQERVPGRFRDYMGHEKHGSFSLQNTLLPKADKNTSPLYRQKTWIPVT